MTDTSVPLGAGFQQAAEPTVVFRSSDPVECGAIASALSEAGVQAWLHDDPAYFLGSGDACLELCAGRPSCVSVPAQMQQHALGIIQALKPRAYREQRRLQAEPFQGFGYQAPTRGRVLAWLVVAVFVVLLVIAIVRLWHGQSF